MVEVGERFREQGRKTRRLTVSHAFHSPLMDPMLDDFRAAIEGVTFHEPRLPVIATGDVTTVDYWVRHVREPVRFAQNVSTLADQGAGVFLELGPDAVLAPMMVESVESPVVHSLRKDRDDETAFLTALAKVHVAGVAVDWTSLVAGGRRIDLPTYAFEHQRYWPEATTTPVTADPVDAEFWSLVQDEDLESVASELDLDSDTAAVVVPALSGWRNRRRARSVVDALRYRETWVRLDEPAETTSGRWLAIVPADGDAEWADSVLAALGTDVVRVTADTADRAELAKRLTEHAEPGLAGVVSLTATAQAAPSGAVPGGLVLSLITVQALGDAGIDAPLWCVTRGAVSLGENEAVLRPEQGTLWGLGRAAALELPRRWGGLVDLPEVVDDDVAAALARALTGAGDEDQLIVRSGDVFGRRLERAPSTGENAGEWRFRGTVLITGGTGGLGGHVARWAVTNGAEHVVLTSRRGPDAPGAAERRDELTALGARVTVVACDAADRDGLARVVADLPAELPLRAVVHAAGVVVDDAPVAELTVDQLDTFLRSKMVAANNLHELTKDLELDAFVMYSSGASSWGAGGQPAYGAANAYLDALAKVRKGAGLPATAMAWGSWAGAGMGAAEPETIQAMERRGVLSMEPALAIGALQQALEEDRTLLTVTNTIWERFVPSFTAARPSPLLTGIPEARDALSDVDEPAAGGESALAQRLAELPEDERDDAVVELVRAQTAAVLGHTGAEAIAVDQAFREQGFDSVAAVDMRERLKNATGLPIPASLVFDHPTPRAVAGFLLSKLVVADSTARGSVQDELARFEAALWATSADGPDRAEIQSRLEKIVSRLRTPSTSTTSPASSANGATDDDIHSVPVDQLLSIIDEQLSDRS